MFEFRLFSVLVMGRSRTGLKTVGNLETCCVGRRETMSGMCAPMLTRKRSLSRFMFLLLVPLPSNQTLIGDRGDWRD